MKATLVQSLLSMYGGATKKRAEAIGTELRGEGLLPLGGRGLSAPDISCDEAAMYTLAVAGAERVADAASTAQALAKLENRDGVCLLKRLSDFICNEKLAGTCRYIHVLPVVNMAEITYRENGRRERFFDIQRWEEKGFNPDAQGQAFAGRIGHIGGAVIEQMAIDFADRASAGWEEE